MGKSHKTISIPDDISQDIQKRKEECSFNFSDWVEKIYRDSFMSIDDKKREIAESEKRIILLKDEIDQIEIRKETFGSSLTRDELRFIKQIPKLLFEGKELEPLCTRFNITFKRKFTKQELKSYVKFYSKKSS